MIEITFTGETLDDLAGQAAAFASTVLRPLTAPAEQPKPGRRAEQPKPGRRAEKVKPEAAAAEVDPPLEGHRADKTVADLKAAGYESGEPDLKALEATKEKALDILRNVYNSGPEGQKAVRGILKDFGVKKAGDVPAEKAEELLAAARGALVEIEAD